MVLLFVDTLIREDYHTLFIKIAIVMLLWLLPIVASLIDLFTGIKASKVSNNRRKLHSNGMRKTVYKMLGYLSLLIVFFLIDFATSYLATLSDIVGFFGVFRVPIFTLLSSVLLCAIEVWSIKENIEIINHSEIIPNKTLDKAIDLVRVLGDDKIGRILEVLREPNSNSLKERDYK